MKSVVIAAICISVFSRTCFSQNETTTGEFAQKNCRKRTRLIRSERGDTYGVVDAALGQKLMLQCHYCDENDDYRPKLWYKTQKLSSNVTEEVKLDMESNLTLNRVHVNPEHTLTIHNVTEDDLGLYCCMGIDGQEAENKYNFLVDSKKILDDTKRDDFVCPLWLKYHKLYMEPINKLLFGSLGEEFVRLRDTFGVQLEMVTEWDSWSPCEICGRPLGEGLKKRKGFCRLKINKNNTSVVSGSNLKQMTFDEDFFLNAFEVSCRSLVFSRLFPGVYNQTKIVPNFVQEAHCDGICNPDAEGVNKGWKAGKSSKYKYRKSFVLTEGSHLTLICPESTINNKISWRRNGRVLKAGESVQPEKADEEPHIIVDTFNTLYLHSVKHSEEGNYTCQVDDILMQQVRIFVVSKSRLLTRAFVRHVIYLGFILSLTLTCYCAGLVITCTKWRTFKTYKDVKEAMDRNANIYNRVESVEEAEDSV